MKAKAEPGNAKAAEEISPRDRKSIFDHCAGTLHRFFDRTKGTECPQIVSERISRSPRRRAEIVR